MPWIGRSAMLLYRLLLVLKFVGVLLYAGGLFGSFLSRSLDDRRRAVHRIASPGLLLIWTTGYLLTTQIGVPLTELWTIGGLFLSLLSQMALVHAVIRDRRTFGAFAASFVPLVAVLVLMVFRPTWARLGS